jgi:streptogramin lyase
MKMGHRIDRRIAGTTLAAALLCLTLASPALAGGPFHTRAKSLDIPNLNHACGAAVDSKGDFYASSAGTSEVKVYNAAHTLLTSIADTHEPCSLAVTTTGDLYVSEKATGEVVRFKPNVYPFVGTPTYGPREVIDSSGVA